MTLSLEVTCMKHEKIMDMETEKPVLSHDCVKMTQYTEIFSIFKKYSGEGGRR